MGLIECHTCDGLGKLIHDVDVQEECPNCYGEGFEIEGD